jgi:hypothetical protein
MSQETDQHCLDGRLEQLDKEIRQWELFNRLLPLPFFAFLFSILFLGLTA